MKSLYTKLFFTGIWVAVLPHLGFPASWRRILLALTGALLIYFAYEARKFIQSKPKEMSDHARSFSEHDPRMNTETSSENKAPSDQFVITE